MRGSTAPPFYDLVAIGASAGGVEALVQLVSTLPVGFPAPIVVAQHLDPMRPSHLAAILARRSALRVQAMADDESHQLELGVIYVVPSNRDVEIADGAVRLRVSDAHHAMPSIDRLFASAAHVYGERLIAVILTGSGSDGALGAQAVKAAGGTIIIENPETASYPSMPASLPPTVVDVVADLDHMGSLLVDLLAGGYAPVQPDDEALLASLLQQLHDRGGIDFAQYKRSTILRHLQRRMAATTTRTLRAYLRYLQHNPDEYARLVTSFLTKVTEFFRDPDVFAVLREQVLPELIRATRTRDHQIRVWSAGCATGEEPYSLAMLFCELLGDELGQFVIRIYATDVDEQLVAFARRGVYPSAALEQLPSELKQRYFTPVDGGWAVVPKLRNLVIFGEHDLGRRAPFPQIDLVLCRNILNYLSPDLRKRALQLFAYALRDGGYLALGQTETATALAECFAPVNDDLKIYRRYGERILVPPLRSRGQDIFDTSPVGTPSPAQQHLPTTTMPSTSSPVVFRRPQSHPSSQSAAEGTPTMPEAALSHASTSHERLGALLLGLPTGVAVIDQQFDIVTINSAACQLLGIYRPAIGKDILHVVERVPITPLRAALDAIFHPPASPGTSSQRREQTLVLAATAGEPSTVHLTLHPVAALPTTTAAAEEVLSTDGHSSEPAQQPGASLPVAAVLLLVTPGPAMAADAASGVAAPNLTQGSRPRSGGKGRRARRDAPMAPADPTTVDLAHEFDQTRAELAQTRLQYERLLAFTRELEIANQELMSANLQLHQASEQERRRQEDLQADSDEAHTLNEELQATNEELETLNEEIEATTEQLRTTNEDLLARSHELQQAAELREAQRVASERDRAHLAAILAQMADPVLVVDAQGQRLIANRAYTALFGEPQFTTTAATASSPALHDLNGNPLPAEATPGARVSEGAPFQMEFLLMVSEGVPRWFEAQGQPILDEHGARLGGVVTVHELTDRTLRSLEELFLQLAVHELRTPLAVVFGSLQRQQQLMSQPSADDALAQSRAFGALALRQAERLRTLIDDVSDLGRVQIGKLRVRREQVDVVALVRQTVETVQQSHSVDQGEGLPRPQIDVRIAPEIGQALWISADPARAGQIFTNLLNNAFTYAPESERIEVCLRKVRDNVEVAVSDHGPGIPAADRPYLFSPYRQVAHDRLEPQGLGLGLFIVAQLVRAHDGTVDVQSEPGQGTTFVVRLPLGSVPVPSRRSTVSGKDSTHE